MSHKKRRTFEVPSDFRKQSPFQQIDVDHLRLEDVILILHNAIGEVRMMRIDGRTLPLDQPEEAKRILSTMFPCWSAEPIPRDWEGFSLFGHWTGVCCYCYKGIAAVKSLYQDKALQYGDAKRTWVKQ